MFLSSMPYSFLTCGKIPLGNGGAGEAAAGAGRFRKISNKDHLNPRKVRMGGANRCDSP